MEKDKWLGKMIEDKVTGLRGIADNKADFLYGVSRYYIQPKVDKDGKVPVGLMVDEQQVRLLTGYTAVEATVPKKLKLKLGSKVLDPIRGVEGVATGVATYINGCLRVFVEPKQIYGKEKIESWWVDEQQLELVKEVSQKQAKATQASRTTGGPARSCSKY